MPFLYKETYAVSGMLISFFALVIATVTTYLKENDFETNNIKIFSLISFILLCLIALIIYHYWQKNLTNTYLDKLKERDIQNLTEKITSQTRRIAELEAENMRLGQIVHKDNSLIPEYAYILRTHLTNSSISEKDTVTKEHQLLERLDKLTEERKGILRQQDVYCQKLPSTKVFSIDSLLSFKQQTAIRENIELQANISCDISYLVEEIIDEEDLHTLLTYLLDNAIHATKQNKGRHIMFSASIIENVYTISVFDSGIPFAVDVMEKLGLEQITTHLAGNGLGMMAIYEILQKYHASFIIRELGTGYQTFTKKLTISFDNKNQYILQTERPEKELSKLSRRTDLQIIRQ